MRDILKKMDITNRVFYNRFHNIDEVLDIIYAETVHRVRESLSIPWDEKSNFFGHIHEVAARTLILTYETRGSISRLIFDMDFNSGENFTWWDKEIRALIRRGMETGNVRPDIDECALSYSIWCFIRGFNADAVARSLPQEEALRRFHYGFGCLMAGIRA